MNKNEKLRRLSLWWFNNDIWQNLKKVMVVVTFIGLLVSSFYIAINIDRLYDEVNKLRKDKYEMEIKLTRIEMEFKTFKQLTSDEFESTWKSFGAVRGNFQALGHGYHLEDNDIIPEGGLDDETE